MMYQLSLILSVIALGACTSPEEAPSSPPAVVENAASATVQNSPASPSPAARPQVDPMSVVPKPNDDYWTARKALLAAGFTPVDAVEPVDGITQDFMVCAEGMEAQRSISKDECPSELVALVEVEACAGTGMGNCKTVWTAPDGRRLIIRTIDGPQPGIVSSVEWLQG